MKPAHFRSRSRQRLKKIQTEQTQKRLSWFSLGLMLMSFFIFGFIFFGVEASLIENIPFPKSYGPMLLSIGFLITSSLFFVTKDFLTSIFWAVLISFFVLLRFQGLGQWWNGLLLFFAGFLIDFIWISQGKFIKKIFKYLKTPPKKLEQNLE